jgi:hypothetical protein
VERTLSTLQTFNLGGLELPIEAAKNFRKLRALGFTVRKTIDTVIATCCIMDGMELLHSDRDFDPPGPGKATGDYEADQRIKRCYICKL